MVLFGGFTEGEMTDPDGLLNFDTISEKVDLGILDGKAQLAVKVRCERVSTKTCRVFFCGFTAPWTSKNNCWSMNLHGDFG